MGLAEDIRALYRENPNISGKEIAEKLGRNDRAFWRTLNHEQVSMRGIYPGKRKNSHAHNRVRPKGMTYFIPPEKREA